MHLLLDDGRIRATMQPRTNGTQSRIYCCDAGHDTLEEAARCGLEVEMQDELAHWGSIPQPKIATTQPTVKLNERTGVYEETLQDVDPYVEGGHLPAHVFDKRLVADDNHPYLTQDGQMVDLLGVPYRIVHETPASYIGIRQV